MCGRGKLTTPADELVLALGWPVDPRWDHPRWNVAPTQDVLALRCGGDHLEAMRFGQGGGRRLHLNARAETLFERPAFRESALSRRCAVVMDGFYEWRRAGGTRAEPYLFERPDGAPFWLAGIFAPWPGGAPGVALVTTTASPIVAEIHDRMPAILAAEALARWLDLRESRPEVLRALLAPDDTLVRRAVSRHVNSAAHDDPRCVAPADPAPQLELF